jgi:hypothetical protein
LTCRFLQEQTRGFGFITPQFTDGYYDSADN